MKYRRIVLLSLSSLVFVLCVVLGTGSSQLNCERSQPYQVLCQQENTYLYGIIKTAKTSIKLMSARVKLIIYDQGDGGPRFRYDVWLEGNKGVFTLRSLKYFITPEDAEEKAEQIRRYIQGEGSSVLILTSTQSKIAGTIIPAAFLLLVNWLLGTWGKNIEVTHATNIDKSFSESP